MGAVISTLRGIFFFWRGNESRQETSPLHDDSADQRSAAPEKAQNVVEGAVAKFSELKDGEMRECSLGEGKVLVIRDKETVHAVGHKCSHYGAPLKNGAYENGRIRCPWHGACFNASTGDIEDFPGMDSIACFKARVEGDDVIVSADADELKAAVRTKSMSKRGDDQRLFLLVGGGAANATAAQTLREAGFKGRILVVSKEGVLPYDRPKLSKAMTIEASKILLRQPEFYDKYDIEFKLNTEVTELDADAKTATLSNGETVKYDAVLVATGGSPRTLPLEGFNSPNVVPLRDIGEAHNIAQATKGKRVVIVGTSFIGMEVASSIVKEATSVICIGMEKVAFERVLGAEVGGAIQKLHVSNKVDFRMEAVVGELKVTDGLVSSVIVKGTGEELPCDFVVVGAGVVPATKFIKPGSTIKLDDREKSILCDKNMKAGENFYAAGDIARFPLNMLHDESARIEHWGMAQYQGMVAALNMVGKHKTATAVPFFWTTVFGKSVRYAGHALRYDEVLIDKEENGFEPATIKFAAFYAQKDTIVAVVTLARDPIASQAAELINAGKFPTASAVKAAIAAGKIDELIKSSL